MTNEGDNALRNSLSKAHANGKQGSQREFIQIMSGTEVCDLGPRNNRHRPVVGQTGSKHAIKARIPVSQNMMD